MVVVAGLGIVCALIGVAGIVLGLAQFVAFVDDDRAGSHRAQNRTTLQIGAVAFIAGLVVTYILARVDGAWELAAPVALAGAALLVRGERNRQSGGGSSSGGGCGSAPG